MDVFKERRGEPPKVELGMEVILIATPNIQEIIEYGLKPKEDLPKVQKLLNLSELGIKELEIYLLFYQNPEGSNRKGYETRIISYLGIMGGRPIQDISEAVEELKRMGAVYLTLPREGHTIKQEKLTSRSLGYSHEPLIVTGESLSNVVTDAFKDMGCKLIHR